LELELFPRIHLKVGRGVSLRTARRWLRHEGFHYSSHKKGLYYDGHDRPDVVGYRQEVFLPTLKACVERRLVIVAHDEMTVQSNDTREKEWVFEDEYRLRKKGVGRGIHRSDVICSTCGHLVDAGESLEYGKNYDGYWTGERFCKQVSQHMK